jgi:hypothetical protein
MGLRVRERGDPLAPESDNLKAHGAQGVHVSMIAEAGVITESLIAFCSKQICVLSAALGRPSVPSERIKLTAI